MAGKTTFKASTQLTASVAELGSVIRLNPIHSNSFSLGLVLDEVLQLVKTPAVQHPVESLAFSLLPNAFQVFHNNLVSVKVGNNILAYTVVYPSHPTSFSSAYLPKKTLGGKSAFGLKLAAQIPELPFCSLNFSRIVKPAAGSDSKVVYSEVYAQNFMRVNVLLSGSNLSGECEQEEASSFFVHAQQALFDIPSEILFVAVRDVETELFTLVNSPDTQSSAFQIGTSWEVVPDRSSFDDGLCLGFLDHAAGLPHASDCYLRREIVILPESLVDFIVELEVLFDAMLPGVINGELQGFGVSLDSPDYLRTRRDFNFGSCIHSHIYSREEIVYKPCPQMSSGCGGKSAFLPYLKIGVSSRQVL